MTLTMTQFQYNDSICVLVGIRSWFIEFAILARLCTIKLNTTSSQLYDNLSNNFVQFAIYVFALRMRTFEVQCKIPNHFSTALQKL